ncbi:MAG: hypothetical protein HZB23_09750 [Deltaproteobacteria bacterium]|nr:hypothetical protein [Deltaproteobacteria bacterium]
MKLIEMGMNLAGGAADSVFLLPPWISGRFVLKRKVSRADYEAELDFYISKGFTKDPESFFDRPENAPETALVEEIPYSTGFRRILGFPSGYKTKNPLVGERYANYMRNRTAYLVHWTHGDRPRKTVLCLHGLMMAEPQRAENMFKVKALFDAGLDVALCVAPFHWLRASKKPEGRQPPIRPQHPALTCEFIGQAMRDVQSCLLLLESLGASEIGVIGASLGGYLGGLLACLSDKPKFVALMVPGINFLKPLGPDSFPMSFPVDRALRKKVHEVFTFHSPARLLPLVPRDGILIVASQGDRLCPFEAVKDLCEKWGNPPHRFLPGGHWLVFDGKARGRAWYDLLIRKGFLEKRERDASC